MCCIIMSSVAIILMLFGVAVGFGLRVLYNDFRRMM